ncbi:MAG: pseudouridine synthase [Cyanobacteria bacterium J06639_1]
MSEPQRVQKILARWGVASRRQSESLILAGRVRVNGTVVTELGTKADPDRDRIELDGKCLGSHATDPRKTTNSRKTADKPPDLQYVLLHKPLGVLSTCSDPKGRRTVLDLLPEQWRSRARLFPVGRLDADSTGAILLTNDGELTHRLTHPRYHLPKTYRVRVAGHPDDTTLDRWRRGVRLEDGTTLPADVTRLSERSHPAATTLLQVILHEGRNRQIRRVAQALGHPVRSLHREAIGSLHLGDLPRGRSRYLYSNEVRQLRMRSGKTESMGC